VAHGTECDRSAKRLNDVGLSLVSRVNGVDRPITTVPITQIVPITHTETSMRHIQHLLILSFLFIGIVACDNVILPDPSGGGSRSRSDSTQTDDSTATGDPSDTNAFHPLRITGWIVQDDGSGRVVPGAPEGTYVVAAWFDGSDYIVFGKGEISDDRKSYKLSLSDELPDELLIAAEPPQTAGQVMHGLGSILITTVDYANGETVDLDKAPGGVVSGDVIYNPGQTVTPTPSAAWIEFFPTGYSMANVAFVGFVPNTAPEYGIVYRR